MKQYYSYMVYLFRVKETGEVIYVGSCKNFGARMTEHRRSLRAETKRTAPIHKYMREHNLQLFKDVEVAVVWYSNDCTKDEALEVEAEYFFKYQPTVKNTRPAEIRKGEYSTRRKHCRCIDDGKEYVSVREAARAYGIKRATLAAHLNKGSRLTCGLSFEYLDQETVRPKPLPYVVRCVEDDQYFYRYSHCAKAYGMTSDQLCYLLKGKTSAVRDGKTFERCNDYNGRIGA